MSMFFTKSAIGASHVAAGLRCQDFSASYHDEERTVVTACDGHGGKLYVRSHLGAKFASEAAIAVLCGVERTAFYRRSREEVATNVRLNILCRWNELVDAHLRKKPITAAEVEGLSDTELHALRRNPVKAYGTTLHAAMLLGGKMICVSLGDGGCFLVKGGECRPAFAEDEDEPVANVTYSLCQDDAYTHLQVAVHELGSCEGAVVCTDGMLNPYRSLPNFSASLVRPAMLNLYKGKAEKLAEFVCAVGEKLGTGDDVSLGIVMKGKLPVRSYSKSEGLPD